MNATCYSETDFLSSFSASAVSTYINPSMKHNRENKVLSSLYYDEIDTRNENLISNYKLFNNPNDSRFDVSIALIPKTEFVKKLLALRKKYLENGGTLLSLEEIANEVKSRRGGLYNGEESIF
jgi:hypothetical protein